MEEQHEAVAADDEPTPTDTGADATGEEPDAPVRAALEHQHERLERQLEDLGHGEAELTVDENFADSGQVAAEQGENRALAQELRDQLDDVEVALGKLDAGTYGTCEVCGNVIGEARLEAMPATRFCIDHAG